MRVSSTHSALSVRQRTEAQPHGKNYTCISDHSHENSASLEASRRESGGYTKLTQMYNLNIQRRIKHRNYGGGTVHETQMQRTSVIIMLLKSDVTTEADSHQVPDE